MYELSENLVDSMINKNLILSDEKEAYIYALICMTESVISVGSILLISVILNDFIPTVLFLITFMSLRQRTGGFHFNSFAMCYIGSICLYLICVLISKINININLWYILVFLSALIIYIIGTINHPNMNFNMQEFVSVKKASRLTIVINLAILLFLSYMGAPISWVRHMAMGIILCAVLLILSKIIKQEEVAENG